MTESPTVLAVGNALVDHTFRVTNIPPVDGGAYILDREQQFGGVETNVAVLLAGLNVDSGIISRLGDDRDGDAVQAHLDTLPIDARRVRQIADEETSYTHVLTDPDGRRAILGGGTSTLNLSLDNSDRQALQEAAVTFASAYAPVSVLRTLSMIDTSFVFDLAGRFEDLERRGLSRDSLDELLPGIDCFVSNVDAARSYVDSESATAPELVDMLRRRGVTRGAITRGSNGSVLFDASQKIAIEAVSVDTVDTTGAGDGFTAGLMLAWVLEEQAMRDAGQFAAAVAAANCLVEGAHSDPPSRQTVEQLLS